ncbi:MAG: substrate-binding domain-containing protein [Alphaproteobacteria bacterium]|nr:substrate-binding domain-containing protein [Alphaproteobacteria bacterium]
MGRTPSRAWTAALIAGLALCGGGPEALASGPTLSPAQAEAALAALPPYQPRAPVSGVIRTWGHVFVAEVMARWEAGFRRYHPDVRFEDNLVSSAAALGALYSGVADIGFVAREPRPMELAGYRRVEKRAPLGFRVMTGAYLNADKVVALGILVHRDNPLTHITFAQLDAVFGGETRRAHRRIRTWGELGLTGAWANRPIHGYAGTLDAAPGFIFSQRVMKGSQLWNEDLTLFDDIDAPGKPTLYATSQVAAAVAKDPDGIGISGAGNIGPALKILPVSEGDSGPYVAPSVEAVASGRYPLTRYVQLFVNGRPGAPDNPAAAEFIRYVLSREGQRAVVSEGDYLPLPPAVAAAERAKLGPP